MNQVNGSKAVFLRMENNTVDAARKILQHAALLIQEANGMGKFGDAVVYSTRPWVLLLCHSLETMEAAILTCTEEQDGHAAIDRKVLESIRLCRVQNLYDLRAILSSIHLSPKPDSKNDLITWMTREKHGQPPILVGVVDLIGLLLMSERWFDETTPQDRKHLFVRYDQLADTLALLTETCIYLNNSGIKTWEQSFGHTTGRYTSLLVTDHGCLRKLEDNEPLLGKHKDKTLVLETLYRIIEYYLGAVV